MSNSELTADTYQILRQRLRDGASELRERFQKLNSDRAAVFGNVETRLGATVHVATSHNCTPRDIHAFHNKLLLGYNVQFGLKTEVVPSDVFSLYRLEGEATFEEPLSGLFDERFHRDFGELYRYYKNTTFSCFHISKSFLYMVFQVGKTPQDFKAFKWAIENDGLRYVDNRSDQEVRYPDQQAFRWERATRDQHRAGAHPHISINDIIFVECVGGDLTIKIEDNTSSGSGIYSEPVENADQTLDDAEIHYCILGNLILLRIRPYLEKEFRYLVYSIKRQQAYRLDAMRQACELLPDDHGIIFPGGVFLQTGISKVFDHGLVDMLFQRKIIAPNGEDFLYQFFQPQSGTYLQLRYNLIRQEVDTPLVCHGQTFMEDGRMITMRAQESPQKHHALQIWQTPFVGPNFVVPVVSDSMLAKIGNRDLVRAMAECQEVLQLIDKDESYADLYVDLVKRATDILDGYFWINREETHQLSEPLTKIKDAATAAVGEFEKVVRVRNETNEATSKVEREADETIKAIERSRFESIDDFVAKLSQLRTQRGATIGLRERKYVDLQKVEQLEQTLATSAEKLGQRCVLFLLDAAAFQPYRDRIHKGSEKIAAVTTVAAGRDLEKHFGEIGGELELLIETVSQLKIDDLTQRTTIVDRTGDLLAELNRVRSGLKARVRDLLSAEMESEFASQSKLLDQTASGALDNADTPEKVDDALTRIMLQVEELEGRFAEFETLLGRLTEKRESLYNAFETRRQHLVETRSRRANGLVSTAERVLAGINSRAMRIDEPDALRAYFASDPMVDKVRRIAEQLKELGDSVRMEDVLGKLKTVADDAIRQQRDRKDLFVDGTSVIRLGNHSFSVHQQPVELTTVVREGRIWLHLTGTQYFEPLVDPALDDSKDLWEQLLPSESSEIYRAEFLADRLLNDFQQGDIDGWNSDIFLKSTLDERIDWLRKQMQARHQEGYSRGVHDRDADAILTNLLQHRQTQGLLFRDPQLRGCSWFAWKKFVPDQPRTEMESWISGFGVVANLLKKAKAASEYQRRIARLLKEHASELLRGVSLSECSEYLFEQLLASPTFPAASQRALALVRQLSSQLDAASFKKLKGALDAEGRTPIATWLLALGAVDAFIEERIPESSEEIDPASNYRCEVASLLSLYSMDAIKKGTSGSADKATSQSSAVLLEGMAGDHSRIAEGKMRLHFHEFQRRLGRYRRKVLPRFERLREVKHRLVQEAQVRLKTQDYQARVLTSFVRNRLIDEVFLPRVGDNLAKQLGTAGENKRTDRMGLLLLISPPGYGKTTLMEYVANRLGLVFVKVNGPALGHAITSLDPSEAKNAAAREEVAKINMALEMGDNVMLYLDDIQHCNTELLQKFIPLCDATRRIEGVWQGQAKTYDLRGRKFAVVMAGNPYTESGQRFQIPDMLSNRADVYNLGEIIGGAKESFEQSYLENCLTSNTALQPLARVSSPDQQKMIQAAERGSPEGIDLEANFSSDQMQEMFSVLVKLVRVRNVVLTMNREYIKSAAQADAYRTEPPFKLQGSYRNMNRIAEKVSAVMNEAELETLILSSYEQDAQTLTRDSESNLLKFKELLGLLTKTEKERWEQICYSYVENTRMAGVQGDDQVAQVLKSMLGIRDGLESIRRAIVEAVLDKLSADPPPIPEQKVLVQHTVPRVMTDLVRSQFQLLYDGLKPVLEQAAKQSHSMDRLQASVEDCIKQYQSMKEEIEKSE